LFAA